MERSCRSAVVAEEAWALAPPHSFGNGALASARKFRASCARAPDALGPAPSLGSGRDHRPASPQLRLAVPKKLRPRGRVKKVKQPESTPSYRRA